MFPTLRLFSDIAKDTGDTKSAFRIAAKSIFLTFPNRQEDISLDTLLNLVIEREQKKGLIYASVARESHKDGTPHYHFLVSYDNKRQITSHKYFHYIFQAQGHYSGVRNLSDSVRYIQKDKLFLEWGSLHTKNSTIQTTNKIIKILEKPGIPIYDIYAQMTDDERAIVYAQAHKLEIYHRRFQGYLQVCQLRQMPRLQTILMEKLSSIPFYKQDHFPIWDILSQNLGIRPYKQKHLHLWSYLPDMGKSSLLHLLQKNAPTYCWPTDNWYEKYRDNTFQFIIWDEFSLIGQKVDFLKLLFAGEELMLPVKGSHIHKTDNPLIITCANHSLRDLLLRKYSLFCDCDMPVRYHEDHTLCNHKGLTCNSTPFHESLYKAICARIQEVYISTPLFPLERSLHNDALRAYETLFLRTSTLPLTDLKPPTF